MGTSTSKKFGLFCLAVLLSIAGVFAFYIIALIAGYILSLINSKYIILEYAMSAISAIILQTICECFKNDHLKKYTYIVFGVFISLLNTIFLITNLAEGESSILANIIIIVLGVISIRKGAKYYTYD